MVQKEVPRVNECENFKGCIKFIYFLLWVHVAEFLTLSFSFLEIGAFHLGLQQPRWLVAAWLNLWRSEHGTEICDC